MAADEGLGGEARHGARSAAFFDLDKTLMQGSSAFQFGRAAYRAGLMSRRQLLADGIANVQFRLRGATDADSVALRERIAASLEGTRVVDLERLGADVLAGILPRIYPQMLALAHEHQDHGRPAYIVTAASQDLAEILATVMALDGAVGSAISEVRDGVYTGRPTGAFVYRRGKATAIRELAAREGFDLEACYAYSDSESDLPML
jgi:HAD superfamily hydrolase (TIGR01490 family)